MGWKRSLVKSGCGKMWHMEIPDLIVVRDIRPSGAVLRTWTIAPDAQLYIEDADLAPIGPWRREWAKYGTDDWRLILEVPPGQAQDGPVFLRIPAREEWKP